MQILPSLNATRAKAGREALGGLSPQEYRKQANAFSSYFDAYLGDDLGTTGQDGLSRGAKAGKSASASDASGKTALASAGLLSSGVGNVVSDPKTVRMSKEDFAQLKDSLRKSGISDKDIEDLEAAIGTPEGLTWGGFMTFLQGRIGTEQPVAGLDVEGKRQVQSFLGKLGFTPGETSQMLSDLEQGQAAKVWGAVSGKLSSLSDAATLTVSPGEAQALAKALGLSTGSQTRLGELFSSLGDGELGGRNIKTALLAIAAEVKDQDLSEAKALAQVKELASQVFVAAQKREFGQSLSDAREDQVARKAMLAREMASDGAGKDGKVSGTKSVADLAFAAQGDAGTAGVSGKGRHAGAEDAQGLLGDDQAQPAKGDASGRTEASGQGRHGKNGGQGWQGETRGERFAREFSGSGRDGAESGGTDAASDKDWAGFWSKIGVDAAAAKTPGAGAMHEAVAAGLASAATTFRTAQASAAQAADPYVPSDILRQVENGMLQNLGQGTHRLTLSLTPESLGAINVMLTVKDKDVQAVIKAETPEAAKILSEQLSRVREQLEQQGLKVSKLEVQTGLSQQQDQAAWQGAGQHNEARRQQEELSMMRTAVRLLGTGSGFSTGSDTPAASVHMATRSEGVDVFA
jgi:flagellar hook-length control protein FliK